MSIIPTTWDSSTLPNAGATLSNNDLTLTCVSSSLDCGVLSKLKVPAGKWYWEYHIDQVINVSVGLGLISTNLEESLGIEDNSYGYQKNNYIYHNGLNISAPSYSTGDIVGIAFDRTNNKLWFSVNNTWILSGNPGAGTDATYSSVTANLYAACFVNEYSTDYGKITARFASTDLAYSAPSGFTAGLGETVPDEHINIFSSKKLNVFNPFPILGGV